MVEGSILLEAGCDKTVCEGNTSWELAGLELNSPPLYCQSTGCVNRYFNFYRTIRAHTQSRLVARHSLSKLVYWGVNSHSIKRASCYINKILRGHKRQPEPSKTDHYVHRLARKNYTPIWCRLMFLVGRFVRSSP